MARSLSNYTRLRVREMSIEKYQVWIEQATGDEVIVDWVSNELVSYLKPNAEKMVRTERQFVFMQLFKEKVDA